MTVLSKIGYKSFFAATVVVSFEDIDVIRRSQHAFINPAITIILHMGAGGHGVPPLGSPNGLLASFVTWISQMPQIVLESEIPKDVPLVQQSLALQKSSVASHQPSNL
ncbi:uncharacterized protein LOC136068264 isoform X1 [Quercus suber]|uniref:uncharacterized protein LOC136068264 isoform X1 n=1 Tax=Quercus suber TaxID=58331 RepID=UPI0032DEAB30